jgi:hypothetical protein
MLRLLVLYYVDSIAIHCAQCDNYLQFGCTFYIERLESVCEKLILFVEKDVVHIMDCLLQYGSD